VDLTAPGEYTIKVSGYEQEAEFPVVVQDTTYPEMEVKVDNWRTKPGNVYSFDKLVNSYSDNDEDLLCGLYNFEKVGELEDYDYEAGDTSEVTYEKTKWDTSLELVDEITLPEEEGWYQTTAVIADRSGNATTTIINFVTDSTGPVITVPSENVTLSKGVYYDFAEDVTVEDNLYPAERCTLSIDDDEFDVIDDAFVNEKAGTYPLTYTAEDPLGNESTLVVNVTIEKKSNKTSSSSQSSGTQATASDGTTFSLDPNDASDDTSSSGSSSSSSTWDAYAEARIAFDCLNDYRAQAGLPALAWSDTLYQGALIRAQELSVNYADGHTRLNGDTSFTILTEVGACSDISEHYAGENTAKCTSSGAETMNGWYNSTGHRNNMLNVNYNQAAVAAYYANGAYYWCTLFMD
jgi:uncharacterized protein YkwD